MKPNVKKKISDNILRWGLGSSDKRDVNIDAVKGFLILCIILEHNSFLVSEYDWIRPFCDAFAAGAFLIITFLWPLNYKDTISFFDKYFAYYLPFIFFVSLTSVANYMYYEHASAQQSIIYYFKAIFIASPADIKQSSAFMYLWFLPCLSFMYLTRLVLKNLERMSYVIAFLVFVSVGTIDEEVLVNTPYSFHVIAFIFLLGIIYSKIHYLLPINSLIFKIFVIVLFVSISIGSKMIGWNLFLALGRIPSFNEPWLLIYYSLFLLLSIPAIYCIMSLLPMMICSLFGYVGKQSLKIYLIHPLIFISITKITLIVKDPALSYFCTIIFSILFAFVISKCPRIENWIFPAKISTLLSR